MHEKANNLNLPKFKPATQYITQIVIPQPDVLYLHKCTV
jgi:hypothetical protein